MLPPSRPIPGIWNSSLLSTLNPILCLIIQIPEMRLLYPNSGVLAAVKTITNSTPVQIPDFSGTGSVGILLSATRIYSKCPQQKFHHFSPSISQRHPPPTFVPSLWHLCRHLPPRRLTATFQAGAPGFPPITEHFPHQLKAFKGLKTDQILTLFSYLAPILPSFLLWHSLQPHSSIPISNTSTHSPSPSHEVGFKSHTLQPSFSDFSSYQSLPFLHYYSGSHSVWHNSAFH